SGQRGAVTWGSGTASVSGVVSAANSLVGASPGDFVGGGGVTGLSNGNYVVRSPQWNGRRGAVTWGSDTAGGSGGASDANSLVGRSPNASLDFRGETPADHPLLVASVTDDGSGRVTVGLTDPTQLSYARGQSQTVTVTPDFLTATLNTGTAVVLQASND